MFIFFASPEKTNQKKREFSQGISESQGFRTAFTFLNFIKPSKILAKSKCYTARKPKVFQRICLVVKSVGLKI